MSLPVFPSFQLSFVFFPPCFLSSVSLQDHSLYFIILWHSSFLLFFLFLRFICVFSSKSLSPFPSLSSTLYLLVSQFFYLFHSFSVSQEKVLVFFFCQFSIPPSLWLLLSPWLTAELNGSDPRGPEVGRENKVNVGWWEWWIGKGEIWGNWEMNN